MATAGLLTILCDACVASTHLQWFDTAVHCIILTGGCSQALDSDGIAQSECDRGMMHPTDIKDSSSSNEAVLTHGEHRPGKMFMLNSRTVMSADSKTGFCHMVKDASQNGQAMQSMLHAQVQQAGSAKSGKLLSLVALLSREKRCTTMGEIHL